jgi:hypothetical protein
LLQAVLASSFKDSRGNTTHSIHTAHISVVGCNAARLAVTTKQLAMFLPPSTAQYAKAFAPPSAGGIEPNAYTAYTPTAVAIAAGPYSGEPNTPCVRGPWFWRSCVAASSSSNSEKLKRVSEEACLVIDQRLPGGRGPATPFFQLRNSPVKHTYGSILLAGSSSSSSSSKSNNATGKPDSAEFIRIAQSYVAAQLNQLSGVVMPPRVRQAQVTLAAKYFSVVAGGKISVKQELRQKAAAAEAVLSSFNSGKMQGIPSCKQLQAN